MWPTPASYQPPSSSPATQLTREQAYKNGYEAGVDECKFEIEKLERENAELRAKIVVLQRRLTDSGR